MLTTIPSEMAQLPYLQTSPTSERCRPLLNYYETTTAQFHVYGQRPDGSLLVLRPMDLIEGIYLSRRPVDGQDDE